jgi:hypothetical protein
VFISLINSLNAQEVCFKIDSVECYRIPWQLKSVVPIHKNEIILEKTLSVWRSKNIIKDNQALFFLSQINFADSTKILNRNKNIGDFNARAVLIIHYNNNLKDTIVFNGTASYHYGRNVYLSNVKFLLWLYEYNPLIDSKNDFIKEEEVARLREENNYMLELNK